MANLGVMAAMVTMLAATAAQAQGSFISFDSREVRSYCNTLRGPGAGADRCVERYRADFDSARNLAYPDGEHTQMIIYPALTACHRTHFPEWDRIRYCAERQAAPAYRLNAMAESGTEAERDFVNACLTQYPEELRDAESCVRTLLRIAEQD
ncbi:hypothetical protein JI664_03620 [Rhodobacter sp. NTK016B]|uniref:hypothetical protein n=1 Tax=Rhodobacter sp. NTK016B TaxID=2759676 RepID=UPI001A9072AD|nr:hypothetical protein [Rhodobacter sp. NTK016B]MBN8291046.1 hypothetical protein [Rhodobacter sp. NTK016B]